MRLLDQNALKTSSEVVGLVFPIHAFTIPWPVRIFLKNTDFSSASYTFAIATRECFARVFNDIDKLLKHQGKRLDAGFSLEMPQNYIPIFETYSPAEVERVENAMLESLEVISQRITDRKTHRPKDPTWSFPLTHGLVPLVSWWYHKVQLPQLARSFYADERCTGCGICERVCLTNKIRMVDGKPIWDDSAQCAYCFACLHFCPEESIQIRGRKTASKERYHHPAVKAMDIAAQKKKNSG